MFCFDFYLQSLCTAIWKRQPEMEKNMVDRIGFAPVLVGRTYPWCCSLPIYIPGIGLRLIPFFFCSCLGCEPVSCAVRFLFLFFVRSMSSLLEERDTDTNTAVGVCRSQIFRFSRTSPSVTCLLEVVR